MPDYPASALAAAERAIIEAATDFGQDNIVAGPSCDLARAALEAAAPILAGPLRAHIDADHGVMVQLGIIADAAVKMLERINMDTAEDRELHARAVGALRGRLDELAAAMKEANEPAGSSPAGTAREDEGP
jgi:hypothetical protein